MRCVPLALALVLAPLAACGKDGPADDMQADAAVTERGFRVESPYITIEPGQEVTYCYFFETPNTVPLAIRKWQVSMTEGSHHMIYYTTPTAEQPEGTITEDECGSFGIGNVPRWTFATQTPEYEVELPQDDGAGHPLGQEIEAHTAGYFQMHYLNAGDAALEARVVMNAEAYEEGVAITRTAPFITYNTEISVGPGAMGVVASSSADVPAGKKFWQMSTHAHKQAVNTTVKDGDAVVFTSDDWEHPGSQDWMSSPFYTFASGKISYSCTYDNIGTNSGTTVVDGPSAATNEMCMATGYYFPASKPITCLNTYCF